MSTTSSNKYEVPLWRILLIYVIGFTAVSALVYRLVTLQVAEEPLWIDQAVDNYTTEISDPA